MKFLAESVNETIDFNVNAAFEKGQGKKVYPLFPIVHNSFNTKAQLKDATDYQVLDRIKYGSDAIRKAAIEVLFERYKYTILAQRKLLQNKIFEHNIKGLDLSDYLIDMYETFSKAIDSVHLERIRSVEAESVEELDTVKSHLKEVAKKTISKDKWKFWTCLNGYLMSKNRDILRDSYSRVCNEVTLSNYETDDHKDFSDAMVYQNSQAQVVIDPEEQYLRSLDKKILETAISNAKKQFTPQQRKIWSIHSSSNKKLTDICKEVGCTRKEYKESIEQMRAILSKEQESLKRLYE